MTDRCPGCGEFTTDLDSPRHQECLHEQGLTFPEVDTSDLADLRRRVEAESRDIPMQGIPDTGDAASDAERGF